MSRRKTDKGKKTSRSGSVALNVPKIGWVLRERSLSWTGKKPGCDVSRATWLRVKNGHRVSPASAAEIARFLDLELDEALMPDDVSDIEFDWPKHPEWEIAEWGLGWQTISNGLSFCRARVQHKHLGDANQPHFGRARMYDLSRVSDRQRSEMQERLTRHPEVCRRLARHAQFITNLSVAPVAEGLFWWVVDEWVEGQTLTEVIRAGAVEPQRLGNLMRQVAEGLAILHEEQIVLRELSPERVLVDPAEHVLLTELDLAKLLLGGKTVSAEWPVDPYRAPEVESGTATPQADFFSWAMIYLQAALGDLTLVPVGIQAALPSIPETKAFKQLLGDCLSPMQSQRPQSAQELIAALR